MSDEEIGKIRLFEFDKGVEFASNVLNKKIAERDDTIKQLQEENQRLKEGLEDAINMWDRLDVYADYQQEINEARKLIEP